MKTSQRLQAAAVDEWQDRGWELVSQKDRRTRTELVLRQKRPRRRWAAWIALSSVAVLVAAGLVLMPFRAPDSIDPSAQVRTDAATAGRALDNGDLVALDALLAEYRGQPDFAYFFTSTATPRELGDALATVVDEDGQPGLKASVDPEAYDILLIDLAGTLALATHGAGDWSLPKDWAENFITATTTPEELSGEDDGASDSSVKLRVAQDIANKHNLLLLLSRGYWSTDFLISMTTAYWEFDHAKGEDAWRSPTMWLATRTSLPWTPRVTAGRYAPAPNGSYLTDGMLALIAALTANPYASAWAFTDFQPGNEKVDGSDHRVGKFAHYLLFKHQFPQASDDQGIGMTATLTALSSAIDATDGSADSQTEVSVKASSDDIGPMHDSLVLQALAKELNSDSGCSWNPVDYWHCAKAVGEAVLGWVKRWGHLVLDILSLATFAPPPFTIIGITAAATNATWYAIEGDYGMAGLSLAAAVPGLAFTKIAKGVKAGAKAEKAAAKADDGANAAKSIKAGTVVTVRYLESRPNLRSSTLAEIREKAPKNARGDFIDPNTNLPITGTPVVGHKPGFEWRCIKQRALSEGWLIPRFLEFVNDPSLYQIEDKASNESHKFEAETCAR